MPHAYVSAWWLSPIAPLLFRARRKQQLPPRFVSSLESWPLDSPECERTGGKGRQQSGGWTHSSQLGVAIHLHARNNRANSPKGDNRAEGLA